MSENSFPIRESVPEAANKVLGIQSGYKDFLADAITPQKNLFASESGIQSRGRMKNRI
jgi:hypothetical protein